MTALPHALPHALSAPTAAASTPPQGHRLASSQTPGLELFIRHRRPAPGAPRQPVPLLMVHGATLSSLLWDHPLPGWSWMDRLAADGFEVFALDLRGYGLSTRPDWDRLDPAVPYARAEDVLADVADAIDFVRQHTGSAELDLLGGSWGSVICGLFAARCPAAPVRRLVLYAPIYCEPDSASTWWQAAADPADPRRVNPQLGAYRWVSETDLRSRWDSEIPLADKTAWRPEPVLRGLFDAAMAQDAAGWQRQPPAFRVPNGTLVDLFHIYSGRSLYDAADITWPTLLIRAQHDQTSTDGGARRLFEALGSPRKRLVHIGNGAHFVILEQQADQVHAEVAGFLQGP